MTSVARDLKVSRLPELTTSDGRPFQSVIVLGKNDFFLYSLEHDGTWNAWSCMCLVCLLGGIRTALFMYTRLLVILYSMQSQASCLLSCNGVQLRCLSSLVISAVWL